MYHMCSFGFIITKPLTFSRVPLEKSMSSDIWIKEITYKAKYGLVLFQVPNKRAITLCATAQRLLLHVTRPKADVSRMP